MKLHILKNIPMLKTITLYFFKNYILLKKIKILGNFYLEAKVYSKESRIESSQRKAYAERG
jgi:hypothetical protein